MTPLASLMPTPGALSFAFWARTAFRSSRRTAPHTVRRSFFGVGVKDAVIGSKVHRSRPGENPPICRSNESAASPTREVPGGAPEERIGRRGVRAVSPPRDPPPSPSTVEPAIGWRSLRTNVDRKEVQR